MGKRQKYFQTILYGTYEEGKHRLLSLKDVQKYDNEVFTVYKNLGGIQDILNFRLGNYDIPCKDFIIELDEELHFNRYRNLTLQSYLYKELPTFPLSNYRNCDTHEENCLNAGSYGGKWKNDSTEKYKDKLVQFMY